MTKLDVSKETGSVKKLDLGPNQIHIYSGMANDRLKDSKPFKFLGL
jgi:choloylglycine hydrolase